MGYKNYPCWIIACAVVGAVIFFTGLLFNLYGNMAMLDAAIHKIGVLVNTTRTYEIWKTHDRSKLKVFMFNITNPTDVTNGKTPILQEIGPYVYDYSIFKVNITNPEFDTLEYNQKFTSVFNASLSYPLKESDIITTMDFALMGTILSGAEFVGDQMSRVKMGIDKIFPNRESVFVTASVASLLFDGMIMNCSDRAFLIPLICRQLTKQAPSLFWKDEKRIVRFAFLHSRNITDTKVFTAYQGLRDIRQRGALKEFNHKTSAEVWGNKYCDMLNGSSVGELHPPHVTKQMRLYYFEDFLGRSVHVDFLNTSKFYDLEVYRFQIAENMLGSPTMYPDNQCFCPRGIGEKENDTDPFICPPNGTQSLAPYYRAPILFSNPMFIYGDPKLAEVLNLQQPEPAEVLTFMEIEPITGIPTRARKAMQFNMELRQISTFPYLSKVQSLIIPGLRVDMSVEAEEEEVNKISQKINKFFGASVVSGSIAALGAGFLIVAAIGFAYNRNLMRRNETKVTSKETHLDNNILYSQGNNSKLNVSSSTTLGMTPTACYQQNYM